MEHYHSLPSESILFGLCGLGLLVFTQVPGDLLLDLIDFFVHLVDHVYNLAAVHRQVVQSPLRLLGLGDRLLAVVDCHLTAA